MELEDIHKFCISLPGATEEIKWEGDLCFCIAKKMFCVTNMHHPMHISIKVSEERFQALCQTKHIFPAPYLSRANWIVIKNPERFTDDEWYVLLQNSYDLVVAKLAPRTRQELGLQE